MILDKILDNWGITNEKVEQVYASAWSIGDKYILKYNKEADWLQNNIKIILVLSKFSIPVAKIIKTVNGADYIVDDNRHYFLTEKIRGKHIEDIFCDDYTERCFDIGVIIAKLHIAFKSCQNEIDCYDNNFLNEMNGWVKETYRNKCITSVPYEIFNFTINELENIYPKLERQLIHRDIHLGNMLFENNEVTGYIDFDLCQINARIFDICYMALSFLIGNIQHTEKTEKWLEMLEQLIRGYETLTPLTKLEKSAIWTIMASIELLFIAYFTNQDELENAKGALEMLMWIWANKNRINNSIVGEVSETR